MRNVIVGAPAYNGTVGAYFTNSLVETCKVGLSKGMNIVPIFMAYDAMVQRARNDIVKIAMTADITDLVFIDEDQDWDPNDFFKLLDHDVSVVGAPVIKKSDTPMYNVKLDISDYKVEENGLVAVESVGTGMLRVKKEALQKIWDVSEEYDDNRPDRGNGKARMVFDIAVIDGLLVSEDVFFCRRLGELGETIYIDPTINVGHTGSKRWQGNFIPWFELIIANKEMFKG